MRRSHHAARLRQIACRQVAQLGDTKIENFDAQAVWRRIENNIVRFDIAVNYVATVRFIQCRADLCSDFGSRGNGQWSLLFDDFYRLSRGHAEWNVLLEALRNSDSEALKSATHDH